MGGNGVSLNTWAMRKGKIGLSHRRENVYTSGIKYVCLYMSVCVCVNVEGFSKSFFVRFFFFFSCWSPKSAGFLSMINP